MKIGVFDSGLGGLLIAQSIRDALPEHDLVYLGDTLHLPYGSRSHDAIYGYTKRCIEHLFQQDCQLIIVACNTASATALRKLQQEYLPAHYPDRRILGVVVPTIEAAIERGYERLGLIGTGYTVQSNVFEEELRKINPGISIDQVATPLLVPLIEYDGAEWFGPVLDRYILPLKERHVEALILSCTHYGLLASFIERRYGLPVLAQDKILPPKLVDYLKRHPEYDDKISRDSRFDVLVSDVTPHYVQAASSLLGRGVQPKKVEI